MSLALKLRRQLHRAGVVKLQVHRHFLARPKDPRHVGHDLSARLINQGVVRHQLLAVLCARDLFLHGLHLVAHDHRTQAQCGARPEGKPGIVLDLLARDFPRGRSGHLDGDGVAHHGSLLAVGVQYLSDEIQLGGCLGALVAERQGRAGYTHRNGHEVFVLCQAEVIHLRGDRQIGHRIVAFERFLQLRFFIGAGHLGESSGSIVALLVLQFGS